MLTVALWSVPRGGALPLLLSLFHEQPPPRAQSAGLGSSGPTLAPSSLTALSCSLRAAVAVPPGPGDLLHGQLLAPDEGAWGWAHAEGPPVL